MRNKKKNLIFGDDDRAVVKEIQICPFYIENGYIRMERNNGYQYKLCVFDRGKNIVVDVDLENQYDFIDIKNRFWLGNRDNKIKSGNRYAVCPIETNLYNYPYAVLKKASKIKEKLLLDVPFVDGNEVLTNEEYKEKHNELNKTKKQLIRRKG